MHKNNKKYGFTLTEVIIVLIILGALALILIPNMLRMVPDDHNIKYKKAFYTIQEIMSDIVNDPEICTGLVGADRERVLDDQFLTSCTGTNADTLRNLIFNRLSTTDAAATDDITTTNGMRWFIPSTQINAVNGAAINVSLDKKSPTDENVGANNGVFQIIINQNGKVTPGTDNGESDLLLSDPTKDEDKDKD